jgi:sugar/nucleoside kinase (ribokinase family)
MGIDTSRIVTVDDQYTAQAYITTDLADNQITAFHPGAMGEATRVDAQGPAAWGIVAPNDKQAMKAHAQAFTAAGIPWIFDPGQALPAFDGDELRNLIEGATALAVNDYECRLLSERTGLEELELAQRVQAMIVTRGEQGSVLHMAEHSEHVAMGMMKGPPNTVPMMGGKGPFGPLDMGGMFTVLKVRDDLAPGDFRDPGWFKHPPGTVASKLSSDPNFGQPPRRPNPAQS